MRVLVVEDDLMIGESLSEALQDEAYTVDWVKDGRQAILTLRVQPYDIILLDLGLPEVDGMGVLTAMRDAKIDNLQVFIGSENPIASASGLTMVVNRFASPYSDSSYIGIVGPTRQSYDKVIQLVESTSDALEEVFKE